MQILENKKILITGVANQSSIATGIAKSCAKYGAQLAFTYQNDRLKPRVAKLAEELGQEPLLFPCDVAQDEEVNQVFTELSKTWTDGLDGFVHAIGFAPQNLLAGDFCDVTTRDGFHIAHDISTYSMVALARAARPYLKPNSSLVAMTYLGSIRVIPSYNVMGVAKAGLEASVRYLAESLGPEQQIRVNSISAGPIKTLASSGVKSFRKMLAHAERRNPLRRNVSTEEVGETAAFLLSNMSSGITGETLYVDSGFHCTAMSRLDVE
ncbi:MAG: enoyl-ACP reductase FabI [Gammaproteobacteria bacterium]